MAGNYQDAMWLGAAPGGFSAQELNKMGAFIGTDGVSSLNDLTPSGSGTTMTFTAGKAIIHGTDTGSQGHYLCTLSATQTYTLPGGVASSTHERTDYLIAKVFDDPIAVVAGGSNEWKVIAVTGTEAAVGSSVAPSLTAVTSYIPIATVKVNSSGIVSVTDQRVVSNHPSLLDGTGALRFLDTTTSQATTGAKRFIGGLQRGASGRIRGYSRLQATRVTTYSLPDSNIATDAFLPMSFNSVNAFVSDDGFAYTAATGVMTLDGGFSISGIVSLKCPGGYGGVRLVTGSGVVVYQLVLAQSNSPFDFLSLPFNWSGDYVGTMTVQVAQQSGAAQTQPANDNSNNPVSLNVIGVC